MPKTKTQAEKKRDREHRIQEKQAERNIRTEARALEIQKELEEQQENKTEPQTLSKKELRQQKKKLIDEPQSESVVSEEMDHFVNSACLEGCSIFSPIEKEYTKLEASIVHTLEKAKQDAEEERLTTTHSARVVQNHSSYCKGLKPVLARLQKLLPSCTIIPGEISQGSAHCEEFELRFQRKADDNTYKFVARFGQTVQEVFITVSNHEVFTKEFICECIEQAISGMAQQTEESEESSADLDIDLSSYNRLRAQERENFWKKEHQQRHFDRKGQECEAKRQQDIKFQTRKLATKGLHSDLVKEYAERDVDIISGKNRGKHSMKR